MAHMQDQEVLQAVVAALLVLVSGTQATSAAQNHITNLVALVVAI